MWAGDNRNIRVIKKGCRDRVREGVENMTPVALKMGMDPLAQGLLGV